MKRQFLRAIRSKRGQPPLLCRGVPPSAADPQPRVARSRLTLALLGLSLVCAGPVLLAILFDHPWLRGTGLPAWPLMLAGCWAAVVAAHGDRRARVWSCAGIALVGTAAFVWGFWVFARMPASDAFARLDRAPDFVLPDQDGVPVALAELQKRGPVHLVFYRGFW